VSGGGICSSPKKVVLVIEALHFFRPEVDFVRAATLKLGALVSAAE
jgi:hypothetical protein